MAHITHSECVYVAGDGDRVRQLFEVLGFAVTGPGPQGYMVAHVDPGVLDAMGNCLYASVLTPAQEAFEERLRDQLTSSDGLRAAAEEWHRSLRADPQRSVHFGVRYDSREELEETLGRLRAAGAPGGPLEGRVGVTGVFFPGDPGAITDTMAQAFVWTDLFASGLLAFGQHIELQWHIRSMVLAPPRPAGGEAVPGPGGAAAVAGPEKEGGP